MPYNWTEDELRREWYLDSLRLDPAFVVKSFVKLDTLFGDAWIRKWRENDRGPLVTLRLVILGDCLKALTGATNSASLIERIATRTPSAIAELKAIAICANSPLFRVECEPPITTSEGTPPRHPDFRFGRVDQEWAYVEVTAPGSGEELASLEDGLLALLDEMNRHLKGRYARLTLNTDTSSNELTQQVVAVLNSTDEGRSTLPSGPVMSVSQRGDAFVDHPQKILTGPHLVVSHGGREFEQVVISAPFTDVRAASIIEAKAKQLPRDSPTLIMVEGSSLRGSIGEWTELIRRRFQPTINTRIGAICIFTLDGRIHAESLGLFVETATAVIQNPYAKVPVPVWLLDRFRDRASLI